MTNSRRSAGDGDEPSSDDSGPLEIEVESGLDAERHRIEVTPDHIVSGAVTFSQILAYTGATYDMVDAVLSLDVSPSTIVFLMVMTVVFIVAIATALARSLDISCGCLNTDGSHGVGLSLLVRDLVLLVLCLPPLLLRDSGPGFDGLRRPSP